MIVPSMTVQEIHKEVFDDMENLKIKLKESPEDFKKHVLRSSKFPFTKTYEFKTQEKKNLFIVDFTALKRSNWKKPILTIYGIYSRPDGKYAVALSVDLNTISIYPPHFFKRYRERILKKDTFSSEEVIRQYFKNDWGFAGAVVNEAFESVYLHFESDSNEKLSFVAANSQGYCFGEKQGNVNIVKTIISDEMLFENQKPLFSKLKNALKEFNRERYGTDI